MPEIKFTKPLLKTLTVAEGKNESLMDHLTVGGLPVASSCGGFGICGRCKVNIIDGTENLTPMQELERDCLRRNQCDLETQRLSCQVGLTAGFVTVDTDYW